MYDDEVAAKSFSATIRSSCSSRSARLARGYSWRIAGRSRVCQHPQRLSRWCWSAALLLGQGRRGLAQVEGEPPARVTLAVTAPGYAASAAAVSAPLRRCADPTGRASRRARPGCGAPVRRRSPRPAGAGAASRGGRCRWRPCRGRGPRRAGRAWRWSRRRPGGAKITSTCSMPNRAVNRSSASAAARSPPSASALSDRAFATAGQRHPVVRSPLAQLVEVVDGRPFSSPRRWASVIAAARRW